MRTPILVSLFLSTFNILSCQGVAEKVNFSDIFSPEFTRKYLDIEFRNDFDENNDWGGFTVRENKKFIYKHIQKTGEHDDSQNYSENNQTFSENLNMRIVDEVLMDESNFWVDSCDEAWASEEVKYVVYKCETLGPVSGLDSSTPQDSRNEFGNKYKVFKRTNENRSTRFGNIFELHSTFPANSFGFFNFEKLVISYQGSMEIIELGSLETVYKLDKKVIGNEVITYGADFIYRAEIFKNGKMFWTDPSSTKLVFASLSYEHNTGFSVDMQYQTYMNQKDVYPKVESVYRVVLTNMSRKLAKITSMR